MQRTNVYVVFSVPLTGYTFLDANMQPKIAIHGEAIVRLEGDITSQSMSWEQVYRLFTPTRNTPPLITTNGKILPQQEISYFIKEPNTITLSRVA